MRLMSQWVAMLAAAAALLAGCGTVDPGSPDAPEGPNVSGSGSAAVNTTAETSSPPAGGTAGAAIAEINRLCTPGPGKSVTQIPDVPISPKVVPGVQVPDQVVGGQRVAGVSIPPTTIGPQKIEMGCIVEHAAPGGCLGAVEISPAVIPAVTIPKMTLPERRLDGNVAQAVSEGPVTERAVFEKGVREEGVCQEKVAPGELVPSVLRPSLLRPSMLRPSLLRASLFQESVCTEDVDCTDSISVDSFSLDSVSADAVSVDAKSLEARTLPEAPNVGVLEGERERSYVAPADVLFEFGRADLTPEAQNALRAIAQNLSNGPQLRRVRVEGHTDSVDEPGFNQRLSEQRARAVADWFVANAGVPPDRLVVTGFGENFPAAPNAHPDGSDNPEGRARNRRVVITGELP